MLCKKLQKRVQTNEAYYEQLKTVTDDT